MKAVVLDFVQAEGTRTHINMLLRSVQHMGHSDALQVTDILHSLTVGYQYSIEDLVAANRPLLIPEWFSPESLKFFPWSEVSGVIAGVPLSGGHHLNRLLPLH